MFMVLLQPQERGSRAGEEKGVHPQGGADGNLSSLMGVACYRVGPLSVPQLPGPLRCRAWIPCNWWGSSLSSPFGEGPKASTWGQLLESLTMAQTYASFSYPSLPAKTQPLRHSHLAEAGVFFSIHSELEGEEI